ncbi:MAG TPA: hypothetical protein PK280_01510 [Planctomycetota bacterium]|nr:hypothetical protein [Planctomycetota bacterium]
MRGFITLIALGLLLGAPAPAGEPGFTSAPRAEKADPSTGSGPGGVRISFAVGAPVDVEVAVLDSKGAVVRHLAAGLLGPGAPEPLRKDSLRQELVWDGRDDAGRLPPSTIHPPPFRVRVRLGLGAEFDKLLGANERSMARLARLAAEEQGLALQMGGYGGIFHGGLVPFFNEAEGYSPKTYAGTIGPVADIAVDRARDQIYVGRQEYSRIDGRTGKVEKLKYGRFFTQGAIMALSPDGETFCIRSRFVIIRTDRNLKPLPFTAPRWNGRWEGTKVERQGDFVMKGKEGDWRYVFKPEGEPVVGKPVTVLYKDSEKITVQPHEVLTGPGITHLQDKGLAIAANGDIYLLEEDRSWPHNRYYLTVFGSDGALKFKQDLTSSGQTCSLRLDARGNIYVADCLRPEGQKLPEGVKERLAPALAAKAEPWLWGMYGSIIKFPAVRFTGKPVPPDLPAGGLDDPLLPEGATGHILRGAEPRTYPGEEPVRQPGDIAALSGNKMKWLVRGAEWMRYGISPVPARTMHDGPYKCQCNTPRFDADPYGRVFYPDMMNNRVVVLDTAGQQIFALGRADWPRRLKDGKPASGDLPLASAVLVAASDEAIYVGDSLAGVVVRARMTWRAEAEAEVR